MFERFTDRARRVVVMAQEEARKMNHKYIGTEHLLLGLLAEGEGIAAKSLGSLGIDLNSTRETVIQTVGVGQQAPTGHIPFTPRAKKVLELALREALQLGHNYIGTEHILLGLIREGEGVAAQVLGQADAGLQKIRQTVLSELSGSGGEGRSKSQPSPQTARTGPSRESHRSGSSILDQFGRNLTQAARDSALDPVIGRSREIDRMMQILARRTKNNPVLIGEPGVGKSAIVEGLAQRIVAGEVPRSLSNQILYTIDLGAMVAGTRYRGDFEERMKKVLKEIRKRGNVIIFLDEIHTVVGAGAAEGAIDAASILKPMLARGELQTIGATTLDEYRKHFERDSALARRFQPVQVDEPSVADAVEILMGLKDRYETFHQVLFTDEAIVSAVNLADRYVSERFLPDKAIDLMDEAGSRKKLYSMSPLPEVEQLNIKLSDLRLRKKDAIDADKFEEAAKIRDEEAAVQKEMESVIAKGGDVAVSAPVIDEEEIAEVLAQWTGIPVHRLTEEETSRLVNMEEELHRRIVAQDDAIAAVSRAIRRTRAGLKDPKRPAGSFIFLGPSGVGKTETAKALTEFLFGNEDSLVQIDMSEYMEKHAVSRLIGSPPGYVGYDEGGQLTEAVRRRPFSVVLFDEIEKAHADVFNILLQILEDGRLTDSHGKSVDFKNVVIIMTSNLGTKELRKKSVGFHSESAEVSYEHMRNRLFDELKRHFRPEFLNRIDEIIVFRELVLEEIKQIIDLLMQRVRDQLKAQRLELVLADSAKSYLAKVGYDPELGARPLRRAIQRYVEDPLSEKVLLGEFGAGTTVLVSLDEENDELVLEGFDVSDDRSEVEAASSG